MAVEVNNLPSSDKDDVLSESDDDSVEDDNDPSPTTSSSSDMKQHALAAIIAIIASLVTFHHTSSHSLPLFFSGMVPNYYNPFSDHHPHHVAYRRTRGIRFCGDFDNSTTTQSPSHHHLHSFDFRIPRELIDTMLSHYDDDDTAIRELFNSESPRDDEKECLLRLLERSKSKNLKGYARAYMMPDIESFYQVVRPANERPGKALTKASVVFTGFAAKFYNLSPKTMLLFWDGGSGGRTERMIGEVKPFQSIGTATFPGQSFRFSPTYDKSHAIARFVATADEAVLSYDPQSDSDSKTATTLTPAEDRIYKMAKLSIAFERDYLIQTGRHWLSTFPRPPPTHYIFPAEYLSQKHFIHTMETHFTSHPPPSQMQRLTYQDYLTPHTPTTYSSFRKDPTRGLNITLKTLSCAPRIFEIRHFLSPLESQHLITLSKKSDMTPSTTNGARDGNGQSDDTVRRSTNTWIYRETDPMVDAIYRRAADLLKIDESLLRHRDAARRRERGLTTDHSIAEALQLVRYGEGDEYTPHHDFHHPSTEDRFQPTRFATLLIYLNDGMEGGETTFPRAVTADKFDGIKVLPEVGKAVLFYNMLSDGNVDDLSQHSGGKVEKGEKWVANLWVWDPIIS